MNGEWAPRPGETPIDPSGLRDRTIRTRMQLNIAESENIRKAVVKYLAEKPSRKAAPFDYAWLLKLHEEMFGDVWEWAGSVRTHDLNLGVPWTMIGQSLGGLCLDIQAWQESRDLESLLEQAVLIHHTAVEIHPFENGNGRWSRMLSNVWLKRHGASPIEWPEAGIGEEASSIRGDYLAAIILADQRDYRPLIELHRQFWPDAWE